MMLCVYHQATSYLKALVSPSYIVKFTFILLNTDLNNNCVQAVDED
jgi:hypothetical protein